MSASDSQYGVEAKEPQPRHSAVEHKVTSEVQFQDGNVTKVTHADGAVDYIDIKAVGGDYTMMRRGYFRSPQFLGTLTVRRDLGKTRTLTNGRPGSMSRQHLRLCGLGPSLEYTVRVMNLASIQQIY